MSVESIKEKICHLSNNLNTQIERRNKLLEKFQKNRSLLDQLEKEKINLQNSLQTLSYKNDDAEKELIVILRRVAETEELATENEKLRLKLVEEARLAESRIETLQKDTDITKIRAEKSQAIYTTVAQELTEKEEQLEQIEKTAAALDSQRVLLEREILLADLKLKKISARTESRPQTDNQHRSLVQDLANKIKEMEKKAETAERLTEKQQKEISILSDKLANVTQKMQRISVQLDARIEELSDE